MADPRSTPSSALIVDDEHDIRELLVLTLGRMGLRTDTAANLAAARAQLAQHSYDLCLTDMRLPDGSGIDLVAEISAHHPNTPTAVITAFGNVEAAVDALKAGAFDFVSKPVDLTVLRGLVQRALDLNQRRRDVGDKLRADAGLGRLSGHSPAMQTLRDTVAKVARSQAPIAINGESGVGKELVARTIHAEGGRASGPFVPVNCGAIPAELMESEFFGHKKGSFTGAHADKAGLFQAADGGTLFLDEIAELPLPMQVKLLRAIQEKSIRPVGASTEVAVDVRILSATHKDLNALVNDGRFRHDLYYRINVIELRVPPLRDRGDDLPILADSIIARLSLAQHRAPPALSESALADGNVIEAADLRLPAAGSPKPATTAPAPAAAGADPRTLDPRDTASSRLPEYMEQLERDAIQQALVENRYNQTRAAAALGITFRALRYKLKKLGID
jgi:two-component system response regulator PilR (NtrC family)